MKRINGMGRVHIKDMKQSDRKHEDKLYRRGHSHDGNDDADFCTQLSVCL